MEPEIKSDAIGNFTLGAEASQTAAQFPSPSIDPPHCTQTQQTSTTNAPNTTNIEANISQGPNSDEDFPLQDSSGPNPVFDWNLLLGNNSTMLDFDSIEYGYDPTIGFR